MEKPVQLMSVRDISYRRIAQYNAGRDLWSARLPNGEMLPHRKRTRAEITKVAKAALAARNAELVRQARRREGADM